MGTPPPIAMANIGMADTMILMVLALVVFGPRRLPQIGRQLGKLMYEFRKASNDFKFQMEEELRQAEEADRRKREEEERKRSLAASPSTAQLESPAESAQETAATAAESPDLAPESSIESPYPGETAYPDLAVEGEQYDESVKDVTADAVEAARLRIQPPSTGEVVAAEPPGAAAEPTESAAQTAAENTASGANQSEPSEPAAHHG
ncbi:MAG: Sec-independent protein translocase subunit TatA/TatB [Terracidiphilus sp.]